jgi:TetR/AcrR family transcriptional repressor of lmrAB and yxaGH operons
LIDYWQLRRGGRIIPGKSTSKGEATRERLVQTTARLLETQGYHATGLKQIIEESGAPKGVIYYHFPEGKDELAAKAVEQKGSAVAANVRRRLAEYDDAVEAVQEFIRYLAKNMAQRDCTGGAPIATTALEAPSTSDRLRLACKAAYGDLQAPFREKLIGAGVDSERAAHLATTIQAAIEGGIILVRSDRSPEPLYSIAEAMAQLVQLELTEVAKS